MLEFLYICSRAIELKFNERIYYNGNVQQKTCWELRGGRGGGEDGERGWETGVNDLRRIEIWLKK